MSWIRRISGGVSGRAQLVLSTDSDSESDEDLVVVDGVRQMIAFSLNPNASIQLGSYSTDEDSDLPVLYDSDDSEEDFRSFPK